MLPRMIGSPTAWPRSAICLIAALRSTSDRIGRNAETEAPGGTRSTTLRQIAADAVARSSAGIASRRASFSLRRRAFLSAVSAVLGIAEVVRKVEGIVARNIRTDMASAAATPPRGGRAVGKR
jgi:hypothetical protein